LKIIQSMMFLLKKLEEMSRVLVIQEKNTSTAMALYDTAKKIVTNIAKNKNKLNIFSKKKTC